MKRFGFIGIFLGAALQTSAAAPATVLTIVVDEPLLTEGGTVVMLVKRLDRQTFEQRFPASSLGSGGDREFKILANGPVTFVEFDAPPGFEYRFQDGHGELVSQVRVAVGEGGGYRDARTGDFAVSDITFHHHVRGPSADEATSRALLGSAFSIDTTDCYENPPVRVCSGSQEDLDSLIQAFKRSEGSK